MKRILAIFAALCIVLPLFVQARVVTEKEVFTVSEKLIVMENQMIHLRLSKEPVYFKSLDPLLYKGEVIGYIVNLEPRGFMLVAALTEQAPQKFVCFSGNFDEVKDYPFLIYVMDQLLYDKVQLSYCLNQSLVQEYCRFPEAADVNQMFKNESNWISLLSSDSEQIAADSSSVQAVGPLLFRAYGQGPPYNMFTPILSGQHTLAGCMPVAMAQIMRYWFYPPKGKGSNSYSWNGTTLSANFARGYYDWEYTWENDLCSGPGGNGGLCQKVARLIADVGISINTDYGLSESSAGLNTNNSLQTFFGYSPKYIKTVMRSSYSSWYDWFCVFSGDLDRFGPALLGFYKPGIEKGHAVVVDGYRTSPSNQVHVSMGAEGTYDNWYSMNNVYGYGDATRDQAVIGITPPGPPPTVKIVIPKDGAVVSGKEYIRVEINQENYTYRDAHVNRVDYFIDGTLIKGSDDVEILWDSTTVSNGSHKLKAIAYNDEGTASEPHEISITVSNIEISLEATRKIESSWLVKKHYGDLSFTASAPAGSAPIIILFYELLRKENDGKYEHVKSWSDDSGQGLGLLINQGYLDKYLDKNKTYTYIVKAFVSYVSCCGKSKEITI